MDLHTFEMKMVEFQSTLLMRGATLVRIGADTKDLFQSTLLMRGATKSCKITPHPSYFNPRSSCEERLIMELFTKGAT